MLSTEGYRLGSDNLTVGEIVFNTAMTGYQETYFRSIIYRSRSLLLRIH
ncbi:carbamoyl-phosphate synthase domain-containing protein [Staphylococcus aureus]|nr:carbamoyl-phosphate synthase domain-containing protein [Staphylococcus aureus]